MMNNTELMSGFGTVEPFESPPPFFGGLPAGANNRVPVDSVYSQLPRPAIISPPWRMSLKTTNEAAKTAFLAVYGGNFRAQWRLTEPSGFFIMAVSAREDAPDPFSTEPMMCIMSTGRNFLGSRDVNEEFEAAFSVMNKMRLLHRLLHLYLRSHGAQVPPTTLDCMYLAVSEEYIRKKWYEGVLDISVVYVDIAISCNRGSDETVRPIFQRLGETMESLGRFKEAATLYKHTAEQPYFEKWEDKAGLWNCAGLAYKRAEDYIDAEAAYVVLLHMVYTHSSDWDINDDTSTNYITNMLMMYYAWGGENSKPGQALMAILFFAGFEGKPGGRTQILMRMAGTTQKNFVKRNIQTRTGARQILDRALASSDAKGFRREILSGMRVQSAMYNIPDDNRVNDVESARGNYLGKGTNVYTTLCANPGCRKRGPRYGEAKFDACPCQSLRYCCKDCQVSHWKAHSATCQWYLTKKKGKRKY